MFVKPFKHKAHILPLSLAIAALSTTACAPVKDVQQSFKETFANDDPCSNNARNIGMVGGALLGAIVANQLGDGSGAAIVGIAAGAGIGALIGQDMDSRRCELHKISQKYQIPIQAQAIPLAESGMSAEEKATFKESDAVGLKVNLQDTGKQFLTGSATLTPQAQAYFADIAKSYSPEFRSANAKKQQNVALQRKILIIGHTDDVGDSNANAVLAEKRAKEVANLFAAQGVPRGNLHYQGAGETQPIADNRTEEGRNKNRRAEIIDLPSQNALHAYLAYRKPVLAYYRAVPTAPQTQANQTMPTTQKTPAAVKKDIADTSSVAKANNTLNAAGRGWNFEGQPISQMQANVNIGEAIPKKDKLAWMSVLGVNTAQANSDLVYESSCANDRPRASRGVMSLETGKELTLKTADYLPGLNGTVWTGDAGRHKIALSGVAVARDGSLPTTQPKVLFYPTNTLNPDSKARYTTVAQANAYHGKEGVLYRLFLTDGQSPVQCMDIVMPNQAPFNAQSGYLIYPNNQQTFATQFKPSKL